MDIELKREGISSLYVKTSGRLDLDNSVEYGTKIKETVEDSEDIKILILDFKDIIFISSFGLKIILELHKQMMERGSMRLINVSEQILKSFKMVGFDKFLVIE
ncbi:STAS domain-containing protein [bacterium]|nr:STAS domain-containing protein [bacterium]